MGGERGRHQRRDGSVSRTGRSDGQVCLRKSGVGPDRVHPGSIRSPNHRAVCSPLDGRGLAEDRPSCRSSPREVWSARVVPGVDPASGEGKKGLGVTTPEKKRETTRAGFECMENHHQRDNGSAECSEYAHPVKSLMEKGITKCDFRFESSEFATCRTKKGQKTLPPLCTGSM